MMRGDSLNATQHFHEFGQIESILTAFWHLQHLEVDLCSRYRFSKLKIVQENDESMPLNAKTLLYPLKSSKMSLVIFA